MKVSPGKNLRKKLCSALIFGAQKSFSRDPGFTPIRTERVTLTQLYICTN